MRKLVVLPALLVCCAHPPATTSADTMVPSEDAACALLKRAAVEYCLSDTNLAGRYYCEPLRETSDNFELGLRYAVTPDEQVGSNLIGWFGIQKSDGNIAERDIAEDQLVPLISRCPFGAE